jgi:hypothetical protein
MRSSLLLVAAMFVVATGGCGDIDVRSVRSGDAVPASLEGEWRGTWRSSRTNAMGAITLQVQEWRSEPLLSLTIDNPCVEPRIYELVLQGTRIELLADGEEVFVAELSPERVLAGSYGCPMDAGTWEARWAAELPPVVDLSGEWAGTVQTTGFPPQVLRLRLEQSVRDGALALDASLELPSLLSQPVLLTGGVQFRPGEFDLVLATGASSNPAMHMSGFGSTEPLQVDIGVVSVSAVPPLPFAQGVWRVGWQGP